MSKSKPANAVLLNPKPSATANSRVLTWLESAVLAIPRRNFRNESKRKLQAIRKALRTCLNTRSKIEALEMHGVKLPELLKLYDASQFCMMYEADLTILICDMVCRTDRWESHLYGRLLAMTMVECVEDIPQVLGKDFRNALFSVDSDAEKKKRLKEFTSQLIDIRKTHERDLRYVRTVAGAHRDQDVKRQFQVIETIDTRRLMKLAKELIGTLVLFTRLMTDVQRELNVWKLILKKPDAKR
jgi:hypothetical protein